jgi:hypothetical protein
LRVANPKLRKRSHTNNNYDYDAASIAGGTTATAAAATAAAPTSKTTTTTKYKRNCRGLHAHHGLVVALVARWPKLQLHASLQATTTPVRTHA